MFDRILVVCVGNICRSPTGERVLKNLLPNKDITSAGIAVKRSGLVDKSADKTATEVAIEHNVDLSGHKAKQLTSSLCRDYDLILVMEKGHINAVAEIAPEARGKVMLFGHWLDQKEIPDPYKLSREVFEHSYSLIEKSAQSWARKLT
ncbi:protein tyrosine phosphatase [Shewanella sp. 5_MG-2023]|uniref:arsenate reductase/protein-tyrosine-phosphatase family protein n=1 Tax=Shewanella sp. 5_MG-2023 TaxID=3062656 RepID=UPI0026E1C1CA|nr:protein tyrosine phosphatase [Shewanella sp. 5_MG-2023]MDO6639197.1 protein tyrosine phosphatase [Shewanella sp. 5_MG-2023]